MIKMTAIKPGVFKADAIYRRLVGAMERTVDLADKEFAKTYKTWEHKPQFQKKVTESAGAITGETWTEDQIYNWVSNGTRGPYPIPKAGPGLLVFPSMYKAKTVPKLLFSRAGGSFGPTVFVSGQVMHPGIEPRFFDKAVGQYVNPWFVKWSDEAVKIGARESGHGI